MKPALNHLKDNCPVKTILWTLPILMLSVKAHALPVPQKATWEKNMVSYGKKHCETLKGTSSAAVKRDATYYDAQKIYLHIRDYTGDASWGDCAGSAEKVYRDSFVFTPDRRVPGYWVFSDGLLLDWLRNRDSESQDAIKILSERSAWAGLSPATLRDFTLSRENAYLLEAQLNARLGGLGYDGAKHKAYVENAFGHLDQWMSGKVYVKPFMVALTAEALIRHHNVAPDSRTVPYLRRAAELLWKYWRPASKAFLYVSWATPEGEKPEPAVDLNLLIAPLYGWLYNQSGNTGYRDKGDQVFASGVRGSFLGNAKQFNQNYRWSFDYVEWREERDRVAPTPTPHPCEAWCRANR